MDVPGDNDCMVWTMRCLFHGACPFLDFKEQTARDQIVELRQSLKAMWLSVRMKGIWQEIFKVWCSEHNTDHVVVTPTKRAKKKHQETVDLLTPPQEIKAEPRSKAAQKPREKVVEEQPLQIVPVQSTARQVKKTIPKPKTAGECKAVKLSEKDAPATMALKGPGKKKKPHALEQPVPDVEDAFHDHQMALVQPEPVNLNAFSPAEITEDMLEAATAAEAVRVRKEHKRRWRSKEKSETEVSLESIQTALGHRGISYAVHFQAHRKAATLRQAALCPDGGWKQFKTRLLRQTMPECMICQKLMEEHGVSLDNLHAVPSAVPALQNGEVEEKSQKQDEQNGEKPGDNPGEEDMLSEYDQCIQVIESKAPIIQLLDRQKLEYRCIVCKTKSQPEGKVNKLVKPMLKIVKHFLNQHLEGPSHLARLSLYQKAQEETAQTGGPAKCPGLCITANGGHGKFKGRVDDFIRWASHTRLEALLVKHEYWCTLTTGEWWGRHTQCTGQASYQDGNVLPCRFCLQLSSKGGIEQSVNKYTLKYYAAQLLRWRLFGTEPEQAAFEEEVGKTHFGSVGQRWKKVKDLKNNELQQFVRKTWHVKDHRSESGECFFGSVVQPCLKIHSSALTSSATALAAQFAEAMAVQEKTDAWNCLDMFVYFAFLRLDKCAHYRIGKNNSKQS